MPLNLKNTRTAALAALIALLAALVLAACGSSSSNTTTTTTSASASASTSTSTTSSGRSAPFLARVSALRECLKKNGITPPARKPGQAGGFQLPNGVTRAQYEAALKKCGAGGFRGLGGGGIAHGALRNNPAYIAMLSKFSACMGENGVKLPPINTSGNGPIFNTSGVNTSSTQFRAAFAKCRAKLSTIKPGSIPARPPSFG